MKLLLGLIVAVLVTLAFTERPSFTLEPMGISTVTTLSLYNIGLTTHKDLMIYLDVSGTPTMVIRRRNAEGIYEQVANFTEAPTVYATTNGKWIATLALANNGGGATLFTIDANNKLSNTSTIASTVGGFLLSDDTFVGYDPNSPLNDGNYTIRTYQYEASNNTWLNIPGTEVTISNQLKWQGDYSSYRVTESHLVFTAVDPAYSNSTVMIYERQADKSWSFMDSVHVNSSFGQPGSVTFNGVDTVVVAYPAATLPDTTFGVAFLYTKSNGVWTETAFGVLDLGYKPTGALGYTVLFLNTNTLLLSASLVGYVGGNTVLNGGKVLMLTRNATGEWQPSLDIVGGSGLFGIGLGANDGDIIAASLISYSTNYFVSFYSVALCFSDPINVTCTNEQVSECSGVDFSSLYTVNNPQCGAVTATIEGFSLVNNQAVETQFSFTKNFGPTVYCNATVTCPAPHVAPVANIQATPTKVSSAGALQLGVASLLTTIALAFM